jgi:hypothetical protein
MERVAQAAARRASAAAGAVALLLAACASSPPAAAPVATPTARFGYTVRFVPGPEAALEVEVQRGAAPAGPWTFGVEPPGGPLGLQVLDDERAPDVTIVAGPSVVVPPHATRFAYRYPLARAHAHSGGDLQRGCRGDDGSYVISGTSYLLRPAALPDGLRVDLAFEGEAPLLAGVLHGGRDLPARAALAVGSFHTFGGRRHRFEVDGATVDVAILGAPGDLAATDAELVEWVRQAASEVLTIAPGFPLRRVPVTLIPSPGVRAASPFGMALGGTVALFVGGGASARDLQRDWVLVHELTHFAHPAFLDGPELPAVVLSEGLATYLSLLARLRSGRTDETAAWSELLDGAADGRRRAGDASLPELARRMHQLHAYRSVYWGGALLALDLDLTLRRATDGRVALDDVVFELRRRERAATLDDLRQVVDALAGRRVFAGVLARHRDGPCLATAPDLLERLGVVERWRGRAQLVAGPELALRRSLGESRRSDEPRKD